MAQLVDAALGTIRRCCGSVGNVAARSWERLCLSKGCAWTLVWRLAELGDVEAHLWVPRYP